MRKTLLGILVLGTALLMNTPSATAFHGAPYQANGTAVIDVLGEPTTLKATVWWNGYAPFTGGTYTIELRTLDTNTLLHKNTFSGMEQFSNLFFYSDNGCNFVEHVDYHGVSTQSATLIFDIVGWQENNLCNGTAYMHYWGHYLTAFQLDLWVWTAV